MLKYFRLVFIFALTFLAVNFVSPLSQAHAESLFSDGFETGSFSNWTSFLSEAGLILQVNQSSANVGNFGLQISTNSTAGNDDAYVRKQLSTSTNELYTRFMLKLASDTSIGNHQLFFSAATSGDGGNVTSTAIRRTSSNQANNLYTLVKGSWTDTGINLNTNNWYCIETRTIISPTTGTMQVWLDNNLIADHQLANTGSTNISWVRLGTDGPNNLNSDYRYDNFEMGTTRIGCETVPDTTPPTASISINNNDSAANSNSVSLSLTCSDNQAVQDVRYSNDGVFDTEIFESYATSKNWTLPSGDGEKTVWYQCRDTSNNTTETSDTIILDTLSPSTSLTSVAGDTSSPYEDTVDDNSTTIIVDGEAGMVCRWYTTDVAYSSSSGTLGTTNGTQATLAVSPSAAGTNTAYVACTDSAGNGQSNIQNLDIVWSGNFPDTTAPVRSNGTPTGSLPSGTTQTTLGLTTNENATCKYSTTSGISYASMTNTFTTTGASTHSTTIIGLSDGNTYNYYVRCEDIEGNENTSDYTISFAVSNPPGAFDPSQLRPIKILTYKDSGYYGYNFEALFKEWYNIDVSYIDPAITLTPDYLSQFNVILHPTLNNLSASEEAALIEWAQDTNHSLIGAHFGTGVISQTLAEQVFGINVGSAVAGSIDRTTVNQSYDLGKIIKYSVVGIQTSNYKKVTNLSANVIANLTTGDPCFLEKNNNYYSCAENLKDVEYHKSPSQPLLLSAIRNLDIAMPKIKFMTIHDDSHRWYQFFVNGTSQRIIDAVTDVVNGYGARDVQGFIANRFESMPDGLIWFKDNEGKHDIISHSYSHQLFYEMTIAEQEQDFILFEQRMAEYGIPYIPFFAAPSHSADLNTTLAIASSHGLRYVRTRMGDILPNFAFTFKDGVYLPTSANFIYKAILEDALNEMLLVTYHGWLGLNNYSHIEDYDTPEKVAMMNQALGIMNSISWAELSGMKEYINLHRLNTNKFYRDGNILFAELTGAFPEEGYVELLVPKANATYCKIADTSVYLLQCSGEEVYTPIPGNASSPIYIEIHNDPAPATIAKLISYENGVFFDKAEYDQTTSTAQLHVFGFGKTMQMYYPQDTFSATDNGVEFARVEGDVLVSSDPLYNVSYNSASNILSFEVPTLLKEANYRTIIFSPTSDTPPIRSDGSPTGTLSYGTTSATLSLNTNENATCKYAIAPGVSYSSMTNVFSATGTTTHSTNVNGLSDGNTYNYYVRCSDANNNVNTTDYVISFSVDNPPPPDTTPPLRSNGTPSGSLPPGTTEAVLGLTTNENATCKYDTNSGISYSSMANTFTTSGSTSHSTLVTGLTDGNTYNYYVRCEDTLSNSNNDDYTISFSVSSPFSSIFSDDFETGDISNWTSSTVEAGNTVEVIPAAAYSGGYGLHVAAGGVNDDSRIMKQIAGFSEAYMRVRVKLNQNVASGTHQGILTATYDANASSAIGAAAIRTQSGYTNRLFSHAANSWKTASDLNLVTGQWYCLETHHVANPTTGRIRIWIDGDLKADENNINTGSNLISWLRLGTDFSVVASDYYFDDFKVSSSQIGCN